MYEVTVDVNERVSTCRRRGTGRRIGRRCENDVVVKDLVVERSGGRGRRHDRRKSCVVLCCCVVVCVVDSLVLSWVEYKVSEKVDYLFILSNRKGEGRHGRIKKRKKDEVRS